MLGKNFHSYEYIMKNVEEHLQEAQTLVPTDKIVGVFLQGSQNYGLDTPNSDIDTKLITLPTFEDVARLKSPVSTTHVRENNEHIDLKDIRLYIETFRKQNLNFLEILFTEYYFLNTSYSEEFQKLMSAREEIAHMNPVRAVRSMKGVALEKYHAMEHPYPSKIDIIQKYGYDGKQVHHLLRVEDFLRRFIEGDTYESCMFPSTDILQHILDYKNQLIPLDQARVEAAAAIERINSLTENFYKEHPKEEENPEIRSLLEEVSYNILKASLTEELLRSNT